MPEKHGFEPFIDPHSRLIILGSFPSIVSQQEHFYYMHPSNHFWKILSILLNESCADIKEKKRCLQQHRIALFDLYSEIERHKNNSSDANLKNRKLNDLPTLFQTYPNIRAVFCNGKTAFNAYKKAFSHLNIPYFALPSSSAANAATSFDEKLNQYRRILTYLQC